MNKPGMSSILYFLIFLCLVSCKADNKEELSPKDIYTSDSLISDSVQSEASFSKSIKTNDISIDIVSHGKEDLKHLELAFNKDSKDKSANKAIQYDGTIQDAVTADLNGDGKNEVYVFNQSAGSGSYGVLFAYQYNEKKLDSIGIDDLSEELSQKYLGHDSFAIDKKHLYRFFPLYNEMDANCCPSGGTIKLKYDLVKKGNKLRLVINSSQND